MTNIKFFLMGLALTVLPITITNNAHAARVATTLHTQPTQPAQHPLGVNVQTLATMPQPAQHPLGVNVQTLATMPQPAQPMQPFTQQPMQQPAQPMQPFTQQPMQQPAQQFAAPQPMQQWGQFAQLPPANHGMNTGILNNLVNMATQGHPAATEALQHAQQIYHSAQNSAVAALVAGGTPIDSAQQMVANGEHHIGGYIAQHAIDRIKKLGQSHLGQEAAGLLRNLVPVASALLPGAIGNEVRAVSGMLLGQPEQPQPTQWQPQPTQWQPQPTQWQPQPTQWQPQPTQWQPQPQPWPQPQPQPQPQQPQSHWW